MYAMLCMNDMLYLCVIAQRVKKIDCHSLQQSCITHLFGGFSQSFVRSWYSDGGGCDADVNSRRNHNDS